jgi:hypothetical protein
MEGGREPFVLSKAETRKHLTHVDALLKLLSPVPRGLDTLDLGEAFALLRTLTSLKVVLEAGARKGSHKEREDEALPERRFITRIAKDLREAFGEVSPVLVSSIASMVDYSVNQTTLRRVIAASSSGKHRAR